MSIAIENRLPKVLDPHVIFVMSLFLFAASTCALEGPGVAVVTIAST